MKRLKDIPFQTSAAPARQRHEDLATLMREGRETRPHFRNFLAQTAQQFDCTAETGPLKKTERSWTKIRTECNGDASQLCDIVRGMLVVEDDELDKIKAIAAHFHPSANDATRSFSNKFDKPSATGFRCLQIKYEMPNGHIAEIMVLNKSMRKIYDQSHSLYKEARTIASLFHEASVPSEMRDLKAEFENRARILHDQATPPQLRKFRL